MRKTKIICTLGPATEKTETIRQLIARGADVFRLNMSHAPREWVREIVPRIRKLAGELGRPVGILLDTQGPAIQRLQKRTLLTLHSERSSASTSLRSALFENPAISPSFAICLPAKKAKPKCWPR